MTAPAVLRVDISSLSLGPQLGSGGQGRVLPVEGFRVNGEWPAVLKIYSPDVAAQIDAAVLEKIVGLPRQLPPEERQWLQENTAWPAVIAEDQGAVSGFLMRQVPREFYFGFRTRTQGVRQQLADTAFLLNPDSYVSSSGLVVSDRDRLALLSSVAATLSRLHALGAAAGDFSPKNVLFSLHPSPGCFLIDCDAVQLRGESVFPQIETPDWEVPSGEAKATEATDAYKFGLLAIRLFARDQSSRDPAALAALSPELGHLAQLSQDPNPAQRPGPGAWASALGAAGHRASTVPPAPQAAAPSYHRVSVPVPPVTAGPPPPGAGPPPVGAAPVAVPPRRVHPAAIAAGAVLAVILVVVVAVVGIHALSHPGATGITSSGQQGNGGLGSNAGSGGSQSPTNTQSTAPAQPVKVGSVKIPAALVANPGANAVAQMFNTYFSGINQQDYQTAASVFDPSGQFDPNNPSDVQALASGLATTTDSRIVLVSLRPSGGQPVRKAEVTFHSHQASGYGPSADPGETCTAWDLTYTLTQSGGQYFIFKVKGTNSPC